jgi:membrane protease YdiL (CAAX protease family)
MNKTYLYFEFLLLYFVIPSFIFFYYKSSPIIPILIIAGIIILTILLRDKTFSNKKLLNFKPFKRELPQILLIFFIISVPLIIFAYFTLGEFFLVLPRTMTPFWLLIMIAYPIFSVYPQSIMYRAFFSHRYKSIFKSKYCRIFIGALVFSYGHIIFNNWIAILFTYIGGLLFMYRYEKTDSLFASWFEHALYGDLIFSLGIGVNFYTGFVS